MNFSDPYDSLEEDSTLSGATAPALDLTLKQLHPADISTIVPLYGKETFKKDVRINKTRSTATRIPTKIKPKKTAEIPTPVGQFPQKIYSVTSLNGFGFETKTKKSYLDLFHARIGLTKGQGSDTTRGLVDENTARSLEGSCLSDNSSEFSDAKSFVSDTSSFYFRFMNEEKRRKEHQGRGDFEAALSAESRTSLSSPSVLNMKSVSQISSLQTPTRPKARSVRLNKSLLNVPVLGSLGPDREKVKDKMLKLKRQQSYGQKASNHNRVKMLEKNVIRNFELELKKSTELDKSANEVLSAK